MSFVDLFVTCVFVFVFAILRCLFLAALLGKRWSLGFLVCVFFSFSFRHFPIWCLRYACADPGNFVRGGGGGGGPGQSDQKSSDKTLFFFLVLSLFYRSQMVNFKEIYHFSRFQRGSNIFQGGGVQLFPGGGGSNYLFPIETHISCDFPGGGSGPLSPLWIRTCRCGT